MSQESDPTPVPAAGWSADELVPFGKYILLDRLSSGATAAVYRAKARGEAGFERVLAVKRILPHMAGDPEFVNTFVREAKTAARLNHGNICQIYELGKVGESLYMAMAYIAGRDLGNLQRRLAKLGETMPPVLAAWIAARLCDALDYAHHLKTPGGDPAGVVHRDLSPTNIIVSYEGQVKLIDFGLAKAVGRAQQTNVDALKAKLGYMSPEMVRGKPLDARSDIFGVGICLYEMLTARRLFAGKDDMATLKMVGQASVPPPSALAEDPPEDLELIIMRALERDPEDRWQSASEMGQALNGFITASDPRFDERRVAEWMRERFGSEQAEEAARILRLVAASNDEAIVRQRREFFAAPGGAAAMAKAEVMRRMSTEPPPARPDPRTEVPRAAPVPAEARPTNGAASEFEDEPTGFYDEDKTQAVDVSADDLASAKRSDAPGEFEDEATGFYDGATSAPAAAPAGAAVAAAAEEGFTDEDTQYLSGTELDGMTVEAVHVPVASFALPPVAATVGPGGDYGFDEDEATEIFFNKEEGLGLQEMLAVEDAPRPQNRPLVDPSLTAPPPAAAPWQQPAPQPAAAPWQQPGPGRAHRTTLQMQSPIQRRPSTLWPLLLGLLFLGIAVAVVLLRTPLGERVGLRSADTGSIEIRTTPAVQASVKLDEVYRGRAPIRMDGVRGGKRRIEIVADGYVPAIREVELRGGTTALVDVSLVPARPQPAAPPPAAPPPTGAPDALDGTGAEADPGQTAGQVRRAPAPRPRIERSGRPGPRDKPGVGESGTLVINTIPWSRVFVDGRDTGRNTPIFGMDLSPGDHVIGLRTPDGDLHDEPVRIEPGQTLKLVRRYE